MGRNRIMTYPHDQPLSPALSLDHRTSKQKIRGFASARAFFGAASPSPCKKRCRAGSSGGGGGGGMQEGEAGEEPELSALRGASAEMEMRVSQPDGWAWFG